MLIIILPKLVSASTSIKFCYCQNQCFKLKMIIEQVFMEANYDENLFIMISMSFGRFKRVLAIVLERKTLR